MKISIIFLICFFSIESYAINNLLFKPLNANPLEGRIGSIIQTNQDNLRLDIGASFDLLEIQKDKLRFGADFFTFTRLRSEKNFKFPVETSDYFFGINSSYKTRIFSQEVSARLRLAHISAHLVDGFSSSGNFYKMPFVYSREFADFTFAIDSLFKSELIPNGIRIYFGHNYIFSNAPDAAESQIFNVGTDFSYNIINKIDLSGGFDYKLGLVSDNFYQTAFQFGLLINTEKNRGIFVGYYYFNGKSLHGLFYNEIDNYSGIGFQIFYN